MEYERLRESLLEYEDWDDAAPKAQAEQFQALLDQLNAPGTPAVLHLLNQAVQCLEEGEVYCEVGCGQGETLIGALLGQPERFAYAVEQSLDAERLAQLEENLHTFGLSEQVVVCAQECEAFFAELGETEVEDKIGLYVYRGERDYRSQLLGLLLVRPHLAARAVLVVAGSYDETVQQACSDFLATQPQCRPIANLPALGIQLLAWDANSTYHYGWNELQAMHKPSVIRSLRELRAEQEKNSLETLQVAALALHHQGRLTEAEQRYRQVLLRRTNDPLTWMNLGMLYYMKEQYGDALKALVKSRSLDSSRAVLHYNFGLVLEKINEPAQAASAYEQAILLDPNYIDAYNNLGNLLTQLGSLEQAEAVCRRAIEANPSHFGSYLNLGNTLMRRGDLEGAIAIYWQTLKLKPRTPIVLYNLGLAYEAKQDYARAYLNFGYSFYRCGDYEKALEQYRKYLELESGDENFYGALITCLTELNREEEALQAVQEAMNLYPNDAEFHTQLTWVLGVFGRAQEVIAAAENGLRLFPNNIVLQIREKLTLPILYDSQEEIQAYRQQFVQGLETLVEQVSLQTPEERQNALAGVNQHVNFYLQYQGYNDLELQIQYAQFVQRIMAASYPDWVKPRAMPVVKPGEKIRIGYVSSHFRRHTVAKLMLGWLVEHTKQDFEIYCYYLGSKVDEMTQQFRLHSDFYRHIPENLEAVCEQILADQLHILVSLDIGMFPPATQLASLRLAPIQCTTWGHPITSGSSAIDYFLSSDLMEPENAQEHYSEKLVGLRNIGISYRKPNVLELTKTRADFKLRSDAIVYLSCQSLFKYLPQYDFVFTEIARRLPQAQFAFLSNPKVRITEQFKQRLKRAFATAGLDSAEYCVVLPQQDQRSYLELNLVSDVFLDTFGWSGGNTTLEAIPCGLPVVTCPSEFMRGRHTYGILRALGVTETIAQNESEYIEIAVRLGTEPTWRHEVVQRMQSRLGNLYEDKTCIEALEAFYQKVVHERLVDSATK
ncbi:tetratricopeptide repeat protein [Leptolyngbya sp. FACHB-261]|uniref:O-linked N-acetylglucosamine transferase family protein n=1 Tax=Leptolyngbya sp. FACHB-261 TaxID=2692806 RepID=UPI0016862A2F|nr:tetratricopeptide repeat protein [Leptolyngbya sp. FACHB-261]MBD2103006.1 tetratricopeptide repeat protein [Leptolyngbya sp. FACHB-261]